jgi:cytochrome P450 family 26 subfamily A
LIGEDLIVSLDPELTNLVFQQEEKMFQIWYPESMMRIMGADCIIATLGSFHKHLRSLVLRLFGPENLRLVLLRATCNEWLEPACFPGSIILASNSKKKHQEYVIASIYASHSQCNISTNMQPNKITVT